MSQINEKICIFTDGASKGNPGSGGWGALCIDQKGYAVEIGGAADKATNNQMELLAIIKALQLQLDWEGDIAICTDSNYAIQGITSWIHGWKKKDWKTSTGSDVLNADLWQDLDRVVAQIKGKNRKIRWLHVKGHAGIAGNERVDQIASDFALGKTVELYKGDFDASRKGYLNIDTAVGGNGTKGKTSTQGHFYISYLHGTLRRHKSWEECKNTVHGQKGALYKKVKSESEAQEIIKKWGIS